MKLKEVVPAWIEYKKPFIKESALQVYEDTLRLHLLPQFGENELIEESEIQDYVLQKIKSGRSVKSVKDSLMILKMVVKFGARNNMIEFKNWNTIYPTQQKKKQYDVLSAISYKKMINYCKEHLTFLNLGIYISISTGMRAGEIAGLTWEDVDIVNEVININKTVYRIRDKSEGSGKTKVIIELPKSSASIREVPISNDLKSTLKPLKKVLRAEYFILTNSEKPMEINVLRAHLKRILSELNISDISTLHGLRHSFATRCLTSGVDPKTLSMILGHTSSTFTINRYVHPDMDQKKSAVNKIYKKIY